MKKLNCVLLLGLALLLIMGCAKDELFTPVDDQETATLKSAKVKRVFTGICTPDPDGSGDNIWYDAADDWRVTGNTIWVTEGMTVIDEFNNKLWGTATLYVDAKNPHDEIRGIWKMTWSGIQTLNTEGFVIVAKADGEGFEGKVSGMKANWTYTMNYLFADPSTLYYEFEGNIDKPQGPIKKD